MAWHPSVVKNGEKDAGKVLIIIIILFLIIMITRGARNIYHAHISLFSCNV